MKKINIVVNINIKKLCDIFIEVYKLIIVIYNAIKALIKINKNNNVN